MSREDPLNDDERRQLRLLLQDRAAGRMAWKWLCVLGGIVTAVVALGASVSSIIHPNH